MTITHLRVIVDTSCALIKAQEDYRDHKTSDAAYVTTVNRLVQRLKDAKEEGGKGCHF
jgi:hypothetical protein